MSESPDPIAEDRAIALSLLKPSQRDLDYGLALHRDAIVVESYGLGLHAPVDPEVLNRAAEQGASHLEYQDLLEDMIMTRWASSPELQEEYRRAWEASGVSCILLNAGEESHQPQRLLKRFARYVALIDAMPDTLQRAVTVDDIRNGHQSGKRSLCLTLNAIPLTGAQFTEEDELLQLRVFAQLGVRMMHLTYNRRNLLADGCAETADGGLSEFGRMAIKEMNRLGLIIDVAHTGWRSCIEAAEASTDPIVASHTAAWALNSHIRCKPDDVVRAIVDRGGAIGVTAVPRFVGGDGTILAMLSHIDYLVKKFGTDAVMIGVDAVYSARGAAAARAALQPFPARARWENFWIPGQEVYPPEWNRKEQHRSMSWTNWPLFTVGMVQRGHSDETIRKILGGNILRIAEQTWRSPIGAAPKKI